MLAVALSPAACPTHQPRQPFARRRGNSCLASGTDSLSAWRQRWLDSRPRSAVRHLMACATAAPAYVSVDLSEDRGTPVAVSLKGGSIELMEQVLTIEGHDFHLIVPRDVEAVMEMYIQAGQEDKDPYWARPWPSAVALATALLQRPELVAGKTVAELGAGLGLAGIAAAMAGAKEVVLLDREPLSLQCALLSAAASGVSVAVGTTGRGGTAADVGLTDAMLQEVAAPVDNSAGLCRAELFDWTAEYTGRKFDVLLACDVLYEDFSVGSVSEVVPQMLFTAAGRLILADPAHRTEANREFFIELINRGKMGLAVEEEVEVDVSVSGVEASIVGGAPDVAVRIMQFNKNWTASTIGIKTDSFIG